MTNSPKKSIFDTLTKLAKSDTVRALAPIAISIIASAPKGKVKK